MKKRFLLVLACLVITVAGFAQSGFGIKAGLEFNSLGDVTSVDFSDVNTTVKKNTGFHTGIVYKINLPLGLALQPELLYTQSGNTVIDNNIKLDTKVGSLQLPVNIQWGFDLMLIRPYIFAAPYVSCAIVNKSDLKDFNYNKFQYGIGLGAGLEIWKLQLSGKYNWPGKGELGDAIGNNGKSLKFQKCSGFELSLAILF